MIEKRIAKGAKAATANKALAKEVDLLRKLKDLLENGQPARAYEPENEEEELAELLEEGEPKEKAFVDSTAVSSAAAPLSD